MLLLVFALGACRTRPASDLDGFVCDPLTGICRPADGGTDATKDAPVDDGMDGGVSSDAIPSSDGAGGSDGPGANTGDVPADTFTDAGDAAGGGSIFIISPVGTAYTHGTIVIQVGFGAGSTPDTVAIIKNAQQPPIGTAQAPFAFSWDTTNDAEGSYQITAQAQVGGKTVTSAPITVVVDRTKPSITSRVPAPNDVGVDLTVPVVVQLSEPLLPSTVTAQSVTLTVGPTAVPTTFLLSADGKTITLSLTKRQALALPATLTVTLATSITDLAGNALVATSWTWTAPLWLQYGSIAGGVPNLVLDSKGRVLVCTISERGAMGGGDFLVNVARHQMATSWDTSFGTPQGVQGSSFVTGPSAILPDADDNPIVAWPEFEGANSGNPATIHVAKWTGTAWDQRYGQLDAVAGSGTAGSSPRLAATAAGQFFAAWQESSQSGVTSVYAARWTGTSWDLSYGGIAKIGAAISGLRVTAAGLPVVTWTSSIDGGGLSSWSGSAWSTKTFPFSGVGLDLDRMQRPTISWTDTSALLISVAHYDAVLDGLLPSAPQVPTSASPSSAGLSVDPSGQILVAWTDSDGTTRNVHLARFDGTSWDTSFGTISAIDGANTPAANPALVVAPDGSPILAWQEVAGQFERPNTFVWKSNH